MMNELIVRLSKEALEYAAEQYGPQRTGEKVWDPYTYDKKFAELIVKECIAKIEEAAQYSPELFGVALDIQDHFGIE